MNPAVETTVGTDAAVAPDVRPSAVGQTLVTLHHGLKGLQQLRADWVRLTRADTRYWIKYPFFEESVRHGVQSETELTLVACRNDAGEATAIVPIRLRVVPIRRVMFRCAELAGSTFDDVACQASSADFPASSPEEAVRALRATIKTLRALAPAPSLLLLGRTTPDGRALPAAVALHRKTRPHAMVGGSKWIDVDRPFSDIQRALSGKFRISLRSSRRNLRAMGSLEFKVSSRGDADFAEEFREFLRIEASGWKGANGTWTGLLVNPVQNQRRFLEAVAFREDLAHAEVHTLRLNGSRIASQLWLRDGAVRVAFKIGYLEEYARYQPGHLLTEHILEQSCADPELKKVDFVSDAAWLDKWRVVMSPHHFHYLPIRRLPGVMADWLLRMPSIDRLREWVGA